tara:strand:+ start:2672 stop:3085 length:414 start_codon:yes stop_codon:yes gene_type:complete
MATLLATATLEINVTIGDLYVRDDYVVSEYVEGGIVALDLDLATGGTIAITSTITTTAVYAPGVVSATLSISSTINMGTAVFDIEVDPYNTFILSKETRLNTVTAETRVFPVLQETRSFKIKRPAFVGTRRRDTINV